MNNNQIKFAKVIGYTDSQGKKSACLQCEDVATGEKINVVEQGFSKGLSFVQKMSDSNSNFFVKPGALVMLDGCQQRKGNFYTASRYKAVATDMSKDAVFIGAMKPIVVDGNVTKVLVLENPDNVKHAKNDIDEVTKFIDAKLSAKNRYDTQRGALLRAYYHGSNGSPQILSLELASNKPDHSAATTYSAILNKFLNSVPKTASIEIVGIYQLQANKNANPNVNNALLSQSSDFKANNEAAYGFGTVRFNENGVVKINNVGGARMPTSPAGLVAHHNKNGQLTVPLVIDEKNNVKVAQANMITRQVKQTPPKTATVTPATPAQPIAQVNNTNEPISATTQAAPSPAIAQLATPPATPNMQPEPQLAQQGTEKQIVAPSIQYGMRFESLANNEGELSRVLVAIDMDTYQQNELRLKAAEEKYNAIRLIPANGQQRFIVAQEYRQEIESEFSDIAGTPAIYLKSAMFKNQRRAAIHGHINESPFKEAILSAVQELGGQHLGYVVYFDDAQMPLLANHLGSALTTPLGSSYEQVADQNYDIQDNTLIIESKQDEPAKAPTSNVATLAGQGVESTQPATAQKVVATLSGKKVANKTKFKNADSYAAEFNAWMDKELRNDPMLIMQALSGEISSAASEIGIDWEETFRNVSVSKNSDGQILKEHDVIRNDGGKGNRNISITVKSLPREDTQLSTGEVLEPTTTNVYISMGRIETGEGSSTDRITFSAISNNDGYQSLHDLFKDRSANKFNPEKLKEQQEKIEAQRQKRLEIEAQRKIEDAAAQEKTMTEWNNLTKGFHLDGYVATKGIAELAEILDLKRGEFSGGLIYDAYPLVNFKNEVVSLQRLFAKPLDDGKNKLIGKGTPYKLEDGTSNGIHYPVGSTEKWNDPTLPIMVTEGLADATSTYKATGNPVAVGMDKSNMVALIALFREKFPTRRIIAVVNNDLYRTKNHDDGNVGVKAGLIASYKYGAEIFLPDLSILQPAKSPSDANDIEMQAGIDVLKHQFADPGNYFNIQGDMKALHKLTLAFTGTSTYTKELENAVEQIGQAYPLETLEDIEYELMHAVPQPLPAHERVEGMLNGDIPLNQPTVMMAKFANQVDTPATEAKTEVTWKDFIGIETPDNFPVGMRVHQSAKTNRLAIVFNDRKGSHKQEILDELEDLGAKERRDFFIQNDRYFVMPKHGYILGAKLNHLTGAPAIYASIAHSGEHKGKVVLKGDDQAITAIQKEIQGVSTTYDFDSDGLVINSPDFARRFAAGEDALAPLRANFAEYIDGKSEYSLAKLYQSKQAALAENQLSQVEEVANALQIKMSRMAYARFTLQKIGAVDSSVEDYLTAGVFAKMLDTIPKEWKGQAKVNKAIAKVVELKDVFGQWLEDGTLTQSQKAHFDANIESLTKYIEDGVTQKSSVNETVTPAKSDVAEPENTSSGDTTTTEKPKTPEVDELDDFDKIVESSSRMGELVSLMDIALSHGVYDADQFEDEYLKISGSPYIDDKGIFDEISLKEDVRNLSNQDEVEWPSKQAVVTLAAAWNVKYLPLAEQRFAQFEKYIDAYVNEIQAEDKKIFRKYLLGKGSQDISVDNPYFIEDELNEELLLEELQEFSAYTTALSFMNARRDEIFAAQGKSTNSDIRTYENGAGGTIVYYSPDLHKSLPLHVVKHEKGGSERTFIAHTEVSVSMLSQDQSDEDFAHAVVRSGLAQKLGSKHGLTSLERDARWIETTTLDTELAKNAEKNTQIAKTGLGDIYINITPESYIAFDSEDDLNKLLKEVVANEKGVEIVSGTFISAEEMTVGRQSFIGLNLLDADKKVLLGISKNKDVLKTLSESKYDSVAAALAEFTQSDDFNAGTTFDRSKDENGPFLIKYQLDTGIVYRAEHDGKSYFSDEFIHAKKWFDRANGVETEVQANIIEQPRQVPNAEDLDSAVERAAENGSADEISESVTASSPTSLDKLQDKANSLAEAASVESLAESIDEPKETWGQLVDWLDGHAKAGLDVDDMFEECFKKDGCYIADNPYFDEEKGRIDAIKLKREVRDHGYKDIKDVFVTISDAIQISETLSKKQASIEEEVSTTNALDSEQYSELKPILTAQGQEMKPFVTLKTYLKSASALKSVHPIMLETVSTLQANNAESFTQAEVLLFADMHGYSNAKAGIPKEEILDSMIVQHKYRTELAGLSVKELAEMPVDVLENYGVKFGVDTIGNPQRDAKAISNYLVSLKGHTAYRIGVMNYVADALHTETKMEQSLPKFVQATVGELLKGSLRYEPEFAETLINKAKRQIINETVLQPLLAERRIPSKEARDVVLSAMESTAPVNVGLENDSAAEVGKYVYQVRKSSGENLVMPEGYGYYQIYGTDTVGLTQALQPDAIKELDMLPISAPAVAHHLKSLEQWMDVNGHAIIKTHAPENNLIVVHRLDAKKLSVIEFNANGETVEQRMDMPAMQAFEYIGDRAERALEVDEVVDEFMSALPIEYRQGFEALSDIKERIESSVFETNDMPEDIKPIFANYPNEDLDTHSQAVLLAHIESVKEQLKESLVEYLTKDTKSEILQTIPELTLLLKNLASTKQKEVAEELQDMTATDIQVTESLAEEPPAQTEEPIETVSEDNDTNPVGKYALYSDSVPGVVVEAEGENATIQPVWYRNMQNAEETHKFISKSLQKPFLVMNNEELATSENVLELPVALTTLNNRDPKELMQLSMEQLDPIARALMVPVDYDNDEDKLAALERLVKKHQIMVKLVSTEKEIALDINLPEFSEDEITEMTGLDDSVSRLVWAETYRRNLKDYVLNTWYQDNLNNAKSVGYIEGTPVDLSISANLDKLTLVSQDDLDNLLGKRVQDVIQMAQDNDAGANYAIKSLFATTDIEHVKRLIGDIEMSLSNSGGVLSVEYDGKAYTNAMDAYYQADMDRDDITQLLIKVDDIVLYAKEDGTIERDYVADIDFTSTNDYTVKFNSGRTLQCNEKSEFEIFSENEVEEIKNEILSESVELEQAKNIVNDFKPKTLVGQYVKEEFLVTFQRLEEQSGILENLTIEVSANELAMIDKDNGTNVIHTENVEDIINGAIALTKRKTIEKDNDNDPEPNGPTRPNRDETPDAELSSPESGIGATINPADVRPKPSSPSRGPGLQLDEQVGGGNASNNVISGADVVNDANATGRVSPDTNGATATSRVIKEEDKLQYSLPEGYEQTENLTFNARLDINIRAIEIRNTCIEEQRLATDAEKEELAKYAGWGGLGQVFEERDYVYNSQRTRIKELLSEAEYKAAMDSTSNAFYTSESISRAIYDALEELPIQQGRILDPATGSGVFLGTMPKSLTDSAKVSALDLDKLSAEISGLVYGLDRVRNRGYETATYPKDYWDAVITNVPFGDLKPHDKVYNKNKYLLHDYFIVKSLKVVRPGGIVAVITSTGTMDKLDNRARREMAQEADLLKAVRLPNGAFKRLSGTDTNADILFFKKHDAPIHDQKMPSWVESTPYELDGFSYNDHFKEVPVNQYFQENPQQVIGEMSWRRGQFGKAKCFVKMTVTDADFRKEINQRVGTLDLVSPTIQSEHGYEVQERELVEVENTQARLLDGQLVKQDDKLHVVVSEFDEQTEDYIQKLERYVPRSKSQKQIQREMNVVSAYIDMRELRDAMIERQHNGVSRMELANDLTAINALYDDFVSKYGLLNDSKNHKLISQCVTSAKVLGLVSYDKANGVETKLDIFHDRVVNQELAAQQTDVVEDALIQSIMPSGGIDVEKASGLLGMESDELLKKHPQKVFKNPETGEYIYGATYLSGDVRTKLEVAESVVEHDPSFKVNVEALRVVQPETIPIDEIAVELYTRWLPTEMLNQFANHIILGDEDDNRKIIDAAGNDYVVNVNDWIISRNSDRTKHKYGTERFDAGKILAAALNHKKVEVRDSGIDGKTVLNNEQTKLAEQKKKFVELEFQAWIRATDERKEKIESIYNNKINRFVIPKYDVSNYDFNGMSPSFKGKEFKPRKHQVSAFVRTMFERNVLLGHGVGTGKTFSLAAIAIQGKHLGVHKKPLIVVPNNVFDQFINAMYQHFPNSNIFALDTKVLNAKGRHVATAQISNGNWDAVILPRSMVNKLDVSPEFASDIIQEQLDEYADTLKYKENSNAFDGHSVRRTRDALKKMEAKLTELHDDPRKDDILYMDELGVDALLVDESDNYLNLATPSAMKAIKGVNSSESKQALNMFMWTRYVQSLNGTVVFATGTDNRNNIGDAFTNAKFLAQDKLEAAGISHHDEYMGAFGAIRTNIEMNPEGGGFNSVTRLSEFHNLPEMLTIARTFIDVVDAEDVDMDLPTYECEYVVVPSTDYDKAFNADIVRAATSARNDSDMKNNILAVMSQSRMGSVDLRLVNAEAPDLNEGKLAMVADNMAEIYHATADAKSTQLAFLDLGVNTEPFNAFDDLIKKLEERGVKREEIIDSRKVTTDAQKRDFENKMNSGKYRIAIGTTERFGVGNNIQSKLYAMHDIDPCWRPREMVQRLGRIHRQGNENASVKHFRYTKEDSFDYFMWQTLERKHNFIKQARKDPLTAARKVSEEVEVGYAQIMSLTTSDPRIKEVVALKEEVEGMQLEVAGLTTSLSKLQYNERFLKGNIADIKDAKEAAEKFAEGYDSSKGIVIMGQPYPTEKSAEAEQKKLLKAARGAITKLIKENRNPIKIELGTAGGYELYMRKIEDGYALRLKSSDGEFIQLSNKDYKKGMFSVLEDVDFLVKRNVSSRANTLEYKEEELDRVQRTLEMPEYNAQNIEEKVELLNDKQRTLSELESALKEIMDGDALKDKPGLDDLIYAESKPKKEVSLSIS